MEHVTTWGERAATTRFQGFVSADDLLRNTFQLSADPRFDAVSFVVADFLDISGQAFDTSSVRDDLAAQALGARSSNARFKIVVVSDSPGISAFTDKVRRACASGGPEILAFSTREDATQWMDAQKTPPYFRDTGF